MTIIKNTQNTIIVTLTEKQTLVAPDWVFELTHDLTGAKKLFTSIDISDYPGRHNKFLITDNPVEIPSAGQMDFLPGSYTYRIYEVPNASPVNIDISNGIECEAGTCTVIGASNNVKAFDQDETKNTKAFDL